MQDLNAMFQWVAHLKLTLFYMIQLFVVIKGTWKETLMRPQHLQLRHQQNAANIGTHRLDDGSNHN
jgi:hypothetical protein